MNERRKKKWERERERKRSEKLSVVKRGAGNSLTCYCSIHYYSDLPCLNSIFCRTRDVWSRRVIAHPVAICTTENSKASCNQTIFKETGEFINNEEFFTYMVYYNAMKNHSRFFEKHVHLLSWELLELNLNILKMIIKNSRNVDYNRNHCIPILWINYNRHK